MASQDPPYNPAPAAVPAQATADQPTPVPPPDYSHHDPQKPEAVYQQHPQPGYQQQPTYVTTLGRLNDQPELVDCPFCNRQAMTRVAKEDSSMTMIAGGLLCLVCICLTCLPCMLGWCQNVDHYCSKCGKQLTHKPHDGTVQLTEAAREAQHRLGLVGGGEQRGPAPGQVPSQYGGPAPPQQQHPVPVGEYGGQQQQHNIAFVSPQPTGTSEMGSERPIQEAPLSPPAAHQEKA